MKALKVIPQDEVFGVSPDADNFTITSVSNGRPIIVGGVSKKPSGWHWHGLGRSAKKLFPDFESAATAAQKAFGSNIQFEEGIS
jgi:hypothetical protein